MVVLGVEAGFDKKLKPPVAGAAVETATDAAGASVVAEVNLN